MNWVINDLKAKATATRHWEKMALMRGDNTNADRHRKLAEEYERAIAVLSERVTSPPASSEG
jgi:hypothetical protein